MAVIILSTVAHRRRYILMPYPLVYQKLPGKLADDFKTVNF